MVNIGINYITEKDKEINKYDNIYKFLQKKGYIDTIKFPGKYCDYTSLQNIKKFANYNNINVDIHGLPGMIPAIYSENCIQNIDWKKIKKNIYDFEKITRISTHVGLENKDKLTNYSKEIQEKNVLNNIKNLKIEMKNILGKNIDIGLENIPGGFEFDIETIKPEFVSENWSKADFGVFDITHAKLSAKDLNMTYGEYLKKLKYKEKVKILHVSGNVDETGTFSDKPDKHVLVHKSEIKDIINTIKEFKNIDLIVSEYAYNTKYNYEKEIIIEAVTLANIIKTMDERKTIMILEFLQKNLKEDLSNLKQILDKK